MQTTVAKSLTQNPPEFGEFSTWAQCEIEDLAHSPVSDESSGYISTSISNATLSDAPVSNIDMNLVPTSEPQEAIKSSHEIKPEEDVDEKEVTLEPEKTVKSPKTEGVSRENSTVPDRKKKTDISDEQVKSSLSERSALASSSSPSEEGPSYEPKEFVTQPCSTLTSPKSPTSAPDADIPPKATHSSTQTRTQTDPLAVPKPSPELLAEQEHALPTQPPTSNPFRIQKVKTSGLKSFKGILQETQEEINKEGVDPLEKLEILSDTEEGHEEGVLPDWLKEDEYVTVGSNKNGTVRYIGPTDFSDGTWVGVELDVPAGV